MRLKGIVEFLKKVIKKIGIPIVITWTMVIMSPDHFHTDILITSFGSPRNYALGTQINASEFFNSPGISVKIN